MCVEWVIILSRSDWSIRGRLRPQTWNIHWMAGRFCASRDPSGKNLHDDLHCPISNTSQSHICGYINHNELFFQADYQVYAHWMSFLSLMWPISSCFSRCFYPLKYDAYCSLLQTGFCLLICASYWNVLRYLPETQWPRCCSSRITRRNPSPRCCWILWWRYRRFDYQRTRKRDAVATAGGVLKRGCSYM